MKLLPANDSQMDEIMAFYDRMCEELGKQAFLPEGNKGGFPSVDMVREAIRSESLYIGMEDDKIIAAYIMNHDYDDAYDTVTWQIEAEKEEVGVLHALRVLPEYSGKGYASCLVEHALKTAGEKGLRTVRLDCIEGNAVPYKMYKKYGFVYIATVDITYVDIGEPRRFLLFERVI